MTLEERVDRLEAKLGSQDELVRELRDAVIVHARLESGHDQRLAEHEKWLEDHTRAIARHDKWLEEHEGGMRHLREEHERAREEHEREMRELRERDKVIDDRIDKLVSGFGEFLRRQGIKS